MLIDSLSWFCLYFASWVMKDELESTNERRSFNNSFFIKYTCCIYLHCSKVWEIMFLKEMNTFIQQGCIKLIKRDSKDIHIVIQYFCFKSMLLFWTLYSSKNPEKSHSFHKNMKQHNGWIIIKYFRAQIFWRSCDTEDCSNHAKIQL